MLRRCVLACATRAALSTHGGSARVASAFARSNMLMAHPVRMFSQTTPPADSTGGAAIGTSEQVPSTVASPESNELARVKDSYLLLLADMENLRERTRREVASAGQFATTRFAKDILAVIDVLEMAATTAATMVSGASPKSAQDTPDVLADGIRMTLDEARKVLERHGVVEIQALGARFDPNVHEALYEVPSAKDAAEPGVVVAVAKKGYTLHGRVLRPAQVGVSK